jgi:endonuclease-8
VLRAVRAVGKQLFLDFGEADGPTAGDGPWLRVHLGLYGAWDFYGRVSPISAVSAGGGAYGSIGAPRLRRAVRIAEYETPLDPGGITGEDDGLPGPVGQVRVRLVAGEGAAGWSLADLRGPSACEVLDGSAVDRVAGALGPDPADDDGPEALERFVTAAGRRAVPLGRLLMNQNVVSGIGNVFRAELLFRARLDPYRTGRAAGPEALAALWRDWSVLLRRGIDTGIMLTRDGLTQQEQAGAVEHPEERHWVYRRQGEPCRLCGNPVSMELLDARKLYWCRSCQL